MVMMVGKLGNDCKICKQSNDGKLGNMGDKQGNGGKQGDMMLS